MCERMFYFVKYFLRKIRHDRFYYLLAEDLEFRRAWNRDVFLYAFIGNFYSSLMLRVN